MALGNGYRDGQRRLSALVIGLDEEALYTYVPLNPAWRVRDVVAHSVGVCEEALAGYIPDALEPKRHPDQARVRDDWTQAQVDRRRQVSIETMLKDWDALATRLEPLLDAATLPPGYSPQIQTAPPLDVGCHLHDVRHALGEPGDRDALTTRVAFAIGRGWLGIRLQSAELPALRLRTPDRDWVLGQGAPEATVEGDAFALFRAVTGRRSLGQVLALDWDGDPVTYLDVLSPYPFPEQDVTE